MNGRLYFTYHVIFIASNYLAVFEELQPRLRVSLCLAHHGHPLPHPPLQTVRVHQELWRIISPPSSCRRLINNVYSCTFISQIEWFLLLIDYLWRLKLKTINF